MIAELLLLVPAPMADAAFFRRLAAHEGFRPCAYADSRGYGTIGYGTRLDGSDGKFVARLGHTVEGLQSGRESVTEAEAMRLMRWKFGRIVGAMPVQDLELYMRLDPDVRDVVDDLLYNLGPQLFQKFPKFRMYLEGHADTGAAGQLLLAASELKYKDGCNPDHGYSRYWQQVGDRARENVARLCRLAQKTS